MAWEPVTQKEEDVNKLWSYGKKQLNRLHCWSTYRKGNIWRKRKLNTSRRTLKFYNLDYQFRVIVWVTDADDVNLLGNNIDTIKKNTETLIDANKEFGLEVNTEKTKVYCGVFRECVNYWSAKPRNKKKNECLEAVPRWRA
jgi:hypothetical protein